MTRSDAMSLMKRVRARLHQSASLYEVQFPAWSIELTAAAVAINRMEWEDVEIWQAIRRLLSDVREQANDDELTFVSREIASELEEIDEVIDAIFNMPPENDQ